ncbi:hypothetical protein Angca_002747 [Angiostrongylus cantonensis]|nr:hypothetical protein Angca_002747 [Angiostrongylus cantonensis]
MNLDQIFRDIDASYDHYKAMLAEAVAIESVSGDPSKRSQTIEMVHWIKERLEELGTRCTLEHLGNQTIDGKQIALPPVLLGQLGDDKKKKTVLVYGHLDVQPAAKEDGWNTEPFVLTEIDNKLFGRGASDDKGPVLSWIHAVEMLHKHKVEIPINIKFCFEAMEESGSVGLEEMLEKNKDKFLADVDFTCISDSYWLGKTKPCLTHGLRGICSFKVEITGIQQDLHSGIYGGIVYEPLADLLWLMSQLTSVDNRILIPGIYDDVAPMTNEESTLYDKIDFNVQEFCESIGAKKLPTEDKKTLLVRRWREPCLSIHGIEGAFSGAGEKTVIPSRVVGKFSIRIVPNMEPEKVNRMVLDYLNEVWKTRGSPNTFRPQVGHHALPWLADTSDENFNSVHGVDPDYIREGCSIPITLTFQELTGRSVLLLPLGAADDMAHSQNEKINKVNYLNGVKTLLAYLLELGEV